MFKTIRWKLIVSSLLAIGLPLALFAQLLSQQLWQFYLNQLEQELRTKAHVIADAAAPILSPRTPDDPDGLRHMVDRWRRYSSMRVTIVDEAGLIRAATVTDDVGGKFQESRRPGLTSALQGDENATVWKNPRYALEDTMYANIPVREGEAVIGAVRVAYTLTEIRAGVRRIQVALTAGFTLYSVLVLVLTLFLAGTIARPLEQLKESATRLGTGELDHRANVKGTQEVVELGTTLNSMAERLQHLEGMRRQYVSNVSHELRTPLAAIRGLAETLIQHGRSDPALLDRYLPRIVAQTDRLARLATQLLDLAQIESGNIIWQKEAVSLQELAADVVATLAPAAEAKRVRLVSEVPLLPEVHADRDRLIQVLVNLSDNALRHTPAGGEVRLAGAATGERVELAVSDTGEGIPAEHLPHLFNRFYRVDASRSRRSGGSGLGLSIVREILEAHGGGVTVESRPGEGTTFRLWLPVGDLTKDDG